MLDRFQLRSQLIAHSIFPKATLKKAIDQLGFVQADPIRSPARCQDLILRHRVKNYKAGDLECRYPTLDLEEDYTFAYGFLPRDNRNLLHPRSGYRLSDFEKQVVEAVEKCGPSKSKDLEAHCGSVSVRNAWGGSSKANKKALETAHHFGYLRVARRDNGIRVYETTPFVETESPPAERFEKLLLLTVKLFGPTKQRFLLSELRHNELVQTSRERKAILQGLVEKGELVTRRVDSIEYVCLPIEKSKRKSHESVKFLAPFDPVVRDRDRFEHLWGWSYRFEAYTPAAKRVRGYYAMPILWRDDVVGWANANVEEDQLTVEIGYVRKPRRMRAFKTALEREVSDLAVFLHLEQDAWRITRHSMSA